MPGNKQTRRSPNYQSFYVEVNDCEPHYSFAVNNARHTEGPYWEHLEINIVGIFLGPKRFKARRLPLVFLGSREQQRLTSQAIQTEWKPRNVGVLTVRGQRNEFLGSLPYDALWAMADGFSRGAFRIIHLYGILERGRAEIQSIHFSRTINPDDILD